VGKRKREEEIGWLIGSVEHGKNRVEALGELQKVWRKLCVGRRRKLKRFESIRETRLWSLPWLCLN